MEHSKQKCESVPTALVSLAALQHMSVKCSKGHTSSLVLWSASCQATQHVKHVVQGRTEVPPSACSHWAGRQHKWEMCKASSLRPQVQVHTSEPC